MVTNLWHIHKDGYNYFEERIIPVAWRSLHNSLRIVYSDQFHTLSRIRYPSESESDFPSNLRVYITVGNH